MTTIIVEDEVLIRMYVASALMRRGFTVLGQTGLGADGIVLLRELQPDVVFVDYRLADGITGLEVARSIPDASRTKAVLMTAYRLHDIEEADMPYFASVVSKPITEADLDRTAGLLGT